MYRKERKQEERSFSLLICPLLHWLLPTNHLFLLYHYLPQDGMINIPIYLVWGCWLQLNSFFFADNIIFNNGYMKQVHTRQRMTNNNNNNKRKQV